MDYKIYCKIGAVFTIILGTLLHFAYDFFGEPDFVAIFSSVNESTWEHLKLLFFPVIIFSIAEYFIYGKHIQNFGSSKAISLIIGMLFIVVSFYTYTGIIGKNFAVLDISLFTAGAVISYWMYCRFIENNLFSSLLINKISVIAVIILFLLFWIYTFYPPLINLFKDPITNGYGI